jgi:hypothetical protein
MECALGLTPEPLDSRLNDYALCLYVTYRHCAVELRLAAVTPVRSGALHRSFILMDSTRRHVLRALADSKVRHATSVRLFTHCTDQELVLIEEAGLIRFPADSNGVHMLCITPRGLEYLHKHRLADT